MSKILNLKQWLTVAEASRYLSAAVCETVSESDVLFFVLQGDIEISIDLLGGAARKGAIVEGNSSAQPNSSACNAFSEFIRVGDNVELQFGREVIHLYGIYELPMFGGGKIALTERHEVSINRQKPELISMVGTFVKRGAEYFQLMEYFEDNAQIEGTRAHHDALLLNQNSYSEVDLKERLARFPKDREDLLCEIDDVDGYIPAWGLPVDPKFIIAMASLQKFLAALEQSNHRSVDAGVVTLGEKEVNGKSETSYINILGALCDLYWATANPGQPFSQMRLLAALEQYSGYPGLSERNLKDKLSLAAKAMSLN